MTSPAHRFFRWLDADISYLARGGTWTSMSQIVGAGLGLLTAYAFATYLPQSAYGTYKYVFAGAALLAIPSLSGMASAVLQAVAQGADGTVHAAMRRKFVFGLAGTAGGLLVSGYYLYKGDMTLGISFMVAAIAIPFIESLATAQSIALGKKLVGLASRQAIFSTVFVSAAVILAIYVTRDPLWILIAYFVSTTIARLSAYIANRRLLENTTVSDKSLRFGMHASIAGVLAVIANNVDVFVLWHSAGAETLALYAFALAAVSPLQTLVKSLVNLAHPKFAAQDIQNLILSTERRARQMFLLLIPVVIAAILVLPLFFELLFPRYLDAVPFAQVMAFSVLFYSEKLYGIALTVAQQSRALYAISLASASSRVIFFLILIPLLGAWGAVISLLLQQIVAFITTRIFFYRMRRAEQVKASKPVL